MKPRLSAALRTSAAVLTLAFAACRPPAQSPGSAALTPVAVATAPVGATTETRTQSLAGTVRPLHQALVAARILGTVTRADLAVGQRVSAGQLLVTLDAAELTARVTQAEAALAQVVADHARELALLAKGATPAATVSNLGDRRHAAEAALAEARALLGYTEIRSPFAGSIARRYIDLGDLAAPGTPLFALSGDTELRAEIEIPATLALPALGTPITLTLPGGTVTGTLAELATASDPLTRTRLAKITLPAEAAARAGDFAQAAWPAGSSATLTLPTAALSPLGQMERVFVIQAGLARLRLIKTAGPAADPAQVKVAAGLEAGEIVILAPSPTLRDGQPISLLP